MRLPARGVLIRLFVYVPLIAFLGWRALDRCGADEPPRLEAEPSIHEMLDPHRRVITLPDGTQQEIVELTPDQAEAILGHPLPHDLDDDQKAAGASGGDEPARPSAAGQEPARPAEGIE